MPAARAANGGTPGWQGDRDGNGHSRARAPRAAILVASEATGGRLAIVALTLVRGAEPPRHLHHWEDEALYVLDGELAVCLGGEWRRVPAGGAVLLRRGVEHTVAVVGEEARVLTVLAPGGFEGFYRELGGAAPDLDQLVATAARYGCEITGPPPTPV